jgi:AraC family transcriptional activator of mtrCDE
MRLKRAADMLVARTFSVEQIARRSDMGAAAAFPCLSHSAWIPPGESEGDRQNSDLRCGEVATAATAGKAAAMRSRLN